MGTYAFYRIWVGLVNDDVEEVEHPFIKEASESDEGIEKEELKFQDIYMHGEMVGFGVEVQNFEWEHKIGEINIYDSEISAKATRILHQVSDIFYKLGISGTVKIYHHIDLGG